MNNQKECANLTNRDMDILKILWDSEKPLTAAEITGSQEGLTINTVQAVLRKLLKQELIEVADIVYSGTVLCRSYHAVASVEQVAVSQFTHKVKKYSDGISTSSFVASMLDEEPDQEKRKQEILELEKMLKEYKKNLGM